MSIRNWFTKKKIIWGIVLIVLAGLIGMWMMSGNSEGDIETDTVRKQDLKQTVLATGTVTSNTDLNLSFKSSGIVRKISVKVGDQVKEGSLLANLDQKDLQATLTSARGSLTSAQANYQKILDGASSEEVQVAQKAVEAADVALNNAKQQQNLAVENAHRAMLNSTFEAEASSSQSAGDVSISGTYNGASEGSYQIRLFLTTGAGLYYSVSGLSNVSSQMINEVPLPIGNGLYATFATGTDQNGIWTVSVPNTKAANYLTNYNAYQTALKTKDATIATAEVSLQQAVANLNLKIAQARPADVKAAQAQILTAQGAVQSALAAIESTEIRAAASGTVTKVDIKLGEMATALTPSIVVQDVGNLYLEANISEANISNLKTGQSVDVTFDALGPDKKYSATIQTVDPASTVVSGVVNYKIKASIDKVDEVKPGMTANMNILTGEKTGILVVPIRSIVAKNGDKFIRVITDTKNKDYEERQITTGFEGDGGLIEVVSGLDEGVEIVTYIDKK